MRSPGSPPTKRPRCSSSAAKATPGARGRICGSISAAPRTIPRCATRRTIPATTGAELLSQFPKPTIAMVHGYAFGGAFTQLCACDFAIAAEDATFGLSEVNWGIIPGGLVSWNLADMLSPRHALYYAVTGDTLDGKRAV